MSLFPVVVYSNLIKTFLFMSYNISKKMDCTFDEAIQRVTGELKKEGFGIISEIDLKEKFKEKLNIEFRNYKILGACNPALAYAAIEQEDKIGTLLPCNVLVQEHQTGGVEVSAINPLESMSAVDNANLQSVAAEVTGKLKLVMERL